MFELLGNLYIFNIVGIVITQKPLFKSGLLFNVHMIKLLGYFLEFEWWIVRKEEVFDPKLIMRLHYTRSFFIPFRFEPLLMEKPFRFWPVSKDICFHLEQSTTSSNQRNPTKLSISGTERNVSLTEAGLHLIPPFDTLTSDTITTPVPERLSRLP